MTKIEKKVEELEKRIKELEAAPREMHIHYPAMPAPIYVSPVSPYQPYRPYPYYISTPTWAGQYQTTSGYAQVVNTTNTTLPITTMTATT